MLAACSASSGLLSPDVMARLVPDQAAVSSTDGLVTPAEGVTLAAASEQVDDPSVDAIAAARAPHAVPAQAIDTAKGYSEVGLASWYGSQFHGRATANGETFNRLALTAAHPSLPLPSYVRVTNLENNRSITVRVNDRGPYVGNRLIDVSEQTAELLAFRRNGTTRVKVDYVSPAPLDTDDGPMLLASYRGPSQPHRNIAATAAPPPPTRVAFAADDSGAEVGEGAMEHLTQPASVGDRIAMAFDAAFN
jgi:rare lipoprotein A